MPPKLRLAQPADIPAIIQLQQQIWEPTYRAILSADQITYMFEAMYSPEVLANQMTTQGHTFVLAEDADQLLGFAAFAPLEPESPIFKLHKIYVLPVTQGTGLGKHLLSEVESRCRSLGGTELLLNVNRYNPARGFYEKQGFRVIREEDIAIGPYWMNDFVMAKPLVSQVDQNPIAA
ncbi:GNAT family N-acetyltransferase [Spirosoma taeanense]|uniref:GNAT family N-acetyltransferase n=1 Tax=Spirosoma taeanense TaxID=2735870 RepID=A0A6M5Y980_9BACT|nr:GNAT family N-acetyltransferase [Spirosoma taeanense]QJW89936.1 GNAT family N-acetyltransferase [Spirosoma taeanense]